MSTLTRLIVSIFVLMIFAGSAPVSTAEPAKYKVVGQSIPKSLTSKPGNAKKGRRSAINPRQGNCLACHVMPVPEQPDHGLVGPPLKGVASRYKKGELRLRLVDSKKINPETIMPAFYRTTGLHRVQKKWKGRTILKAQQVEDILAYLMTLK